MATALISEINNLRTNPKGYSLKVKKYIEYFKGKILYIPNSSVGIQTNEGPEAFKETYEFLENFKPIRMLEPSRGLGEVAKEYLKRMQQVSDQEVENININEIITSKGKFVGNFNKAVDFGSGNAEIAVVNLLVSDGDHTRSQRDALFNTEVNYIGCASGQHSTLGYITIILTCTKFQPADGGSDKDPSISPFAYGGLCGIKECYDVGEEDNVPSSLSMTRSRLLEDGKEYQILRRVKKENGKVESVVVKRIVEE